MSILLTSNIIKHNTGFPIGDMPLLDLVDVSSYLKSQRLGFDVLDAQKMTYQEWVSKIKSRQPKMLLVVLDESFLQSLKKLKADLGEDIHLVVVSESEELISTLIFDFEVDYVYYDRNKEGMRDLLNALSNPFSMFYDHIAGIAYKNGLGEITKTPKLNTASNYELILDDDLFLGYSNTYLPVNITNKSKSVSVINTDEKEVLTDFTQYSSDKQYDSIYLKMPSSKKALKSIRKIMTEQRIDNNIYLYPSCDVFEDEKLYSKMASIVNLSIEIGKAGFFKRFFLKRKLNKL